MEDGNSSAGRASSCSWAFLGCSDWKKYTEVICEQAKCVCQACYNNYVDYINCIYEDAADANFDLNCKTKCKTTGTSAAAATAPGVWLFSFGTALAALALSLR